MDVCFLLLGFILNLTYIESGSSSMYFFFAPRRRLFPETKQQPSISTVQRTTTAWGCFLISLRLGPCHLANCIVELQALTMARHTSFDYLSPILPLTRPILPHVSSPPYSTRSKLNYWETHVKRAAIPFRFGSEVSLASLRLLVSRDSVLAASVPST